jgi:RNA polymerase sigma factor (sigma-70 family)
MSRTAVRSAIGGTLAQDFEEIFREHSGLVYRTAFSVTGSRHDAEDVLQTIFLRLLQRNLPSDFYKNPKGYLYRAAVNVALITIRTRKRQRIDAVIEDVDSIALPYAPVADEDRKQRLVRAISELHPKAVEMLILRYEHDYSDAEIAKMLGRSRGTIAVTLYRARARLKKLLGETA